MGKQLDKDMMRMMTVSERFNYMAAKKQMAFNIGNKNVDNVTCSYSGLPSMEVYKDEPGASLEEQAKHTDWEDDWIDRDDDCLLYTSPSPRDRQKSRMPSSA